jgi:hypothetical protein
LWLAHLLPLLHLSEAAILRATCKAMRAIVADMPADLGYIPLQDLKGLLSCFPKAHSVCIMEDEETVMAEDEEDRLIAWLKERPNSLIHVGQDWDAMERFLNLAWRAGIFKMVDNVQLDLANEERRDLIIEGFVSGVESITLYLPDGRAQVERAALGYLRHFPALKDITLFASLKDTRLPPFIPPSLEKLTIRLRRREAVLLLNPLSRMIESSEAKLRRLQLDIKTLNDERTALRTVGSLIRSGASTLERVSLGVGALFESAVEVAGGLASCQHLEHLTAPTAVFAAMPPGGSITFRVVHLWLSSPSGNGRALSRLALWGVMARGGFPTLSTLSLYGCKGWTWGVDFGPIVVAAFEGVAGTLKTLSIPDMDLAAGGEAEGVLVQLGEAIGKLRRLEQLTLKVGGQGLSYYQVAQGIAKGACPALRSLTCSIDSGAAWLACRPSIILPSVQRLSVSFKCSNAGAGSAEPLALASALVGLGYRGTVFMSDVPHEGPQCGQIRKLLRALTKVIF